MEFDIKEKPNESKSKVLVRWHEVQTKERESRRRRFYIPRIKRRDE